MLWGTTTMTCCHSGIILNTVIIQGFFLNLYIYKKKLWMNSHRHIVIYDTFSIIQTIKIFTIQNWEINRTKPCKKRCFFFRIVLNIHCCNLLRLTKPGYEYSNTCLARHYLKYSITAQHVGIVHNRPFSTMKNNV